MKINVIKSLFSDGNPYIEIKEPFTLDDVEFFKNASDKDFGKFKKSNYGKTIYLSLTCIPKENIKKELENIKLYDRGRLEPILYFIFWSKDYMADGKMVKGMNYTEDYSKRISFSGLRSDKQKENKYLSTYTEFIDEFDYENEKINILNEINEKFNRVIKEFNKKYIDETKNFYLNTTAYEDFWNKIFDKDDQYKEIKNSVDSIEDQIRKLRSDLKEKKKELKKLTNKMVSIELDNHDIPEVFKKDILSELEKVEVKSDPFFGF